MFLNVPDVLPEKPYKKEYMEGYKMRAFMLARYGIMIHNNVVYRRELNYTDSECAHLRAIARATYIPYLH